MPRPDPAPPPAPHERPVTEPRGAAFREAVYDLVRRVPAGLLVSYGGVAAMLGTPRAARGVGAALHVLPPDRTDVPWWRVVNRNGEISSPRHDHTAQLQRALLEGEGVVFDAHGRADWRRFGWMGPEDALDDVPPDRPERPAGSG